MPCRATALRRILAIAFVGIDDGGPHPRLELQLIMQLAVQPSPFVADRAALGHHLADAAHCQID